MQKAQRRRSTVSTDRKLVGVSSDPHSRSSRKSKKASGQPSLTVSSEARELLKLVLSNFKTKHHLIYCSSTEVAKEVKKELDKLLPSDIGATIIREKVVNTFQIIPRLKEEIDTDPIVLARIKKAYHKRFENDPEIKRAKQRAYWAKRRKEEQKYKKSKRFKTASDYSIKK